MSAKSKDRNAKNVLEWVVFAISSLLVAGVVGFLVWSTLAGNGKPADSGILSSRRLTVSTGAASVNP